MDETSNRHIDGHIVVVSGSAALADHVVASIPSSAVWYAADGALDRALSAGLRPALLVGDLDSVGAAALAWAEQHAGVRRHPVDKDATDTELALAEAVAHDPARITLIGGGDRLDHSLAAIGSLGAPALAGVDRLDGWWDGRHFEVLHGPTVRTLSVRPGSTLSLLALHGPCAGVDLSGTRWRLDGAALPAMVGRGISNIALDTTVTVGVETGVLTVFDDPASPEISRDASTGREPAG